MDTIISINLISTNPNVRRRGAMHCAPTVHAPTIHRARTDIRHSPLFR
jgi:hypothetical protein